MEVALTELQPSQLYVCAEKLADVQRRLQGRQNAFIDPLPVRFIAGRLTLTDGHTRALAAFLAGLTGIPACWETDELDWEAYEICVDWCLREGVRSVADLAARIIPAREYERQWFGRCRAMHRRLRARRCAE